MRIFTRGFARPYIVTTVWGYSKDEGIVVAALSPPVVLPGNDSGSRFFDPVALRHLKWYTWEDSQVAAPPDLKTIHVMYYVPAVLPKS